jgi:poly(ADP-ribose) glycohydrolase ARH3
MLFCSLGVDDPYPYQTQLKKMQKLLNKKEGANDEEVETILGTSLAALYSVPTAIFCFLRACAPIPGIEVCQSASKNYSIFSLLFLI